MMTKSSGLEIYNNEMHIHYDPHIMEVSQKHICPHSLNKCHDCMRINKMKAEAEQENMPHRSHNEKGLRHQER